MEGYRDPNIVITQPKNYEGVLLKRRNWPMKGWHKRYFMLVDGMLSYGKTKSDVSFLKICYTVPDRNLSLSRFFDRKKRIPCEVGKMKYTYYEGLFV